MKGGDRITQGYAFDRERLRGVLCGASAHPRRNKSGIELDQKNESSGDQELVGQWIKQHAHGGDLSALAGQIAINAVGNRCGNKQGRSQDLPLSVEIIKTAGREHPNQQRDAEDAGQRDGVRQVQTDTLAEA